MSDTAFPAASASASASAPVSGQAGRVERIERIDALLPQTQCRRCGYDGCRPYATAIAEGREPINRCPPGGQAGIAALAALLGCAALPLDTQCGPEGDAGVAWIDPVACIGCARCLPPCPVDAIVGAQRYLHTVQSTRCTGCELCIASCPVDCIVMRPRAVADPAPEPQYNRRRYDDHIARHARLERERAVLVAERKRGAHADDAPADGVHAEEAAAAQ
ncbi:MAG: RnfABCDGE type electron transport complex subunit B [Steroidobacteraceae bacterium]